MDFHNKLVNQLLPLFVINALILSTALNILWLNAHVECYQYSEDHFPEHIDNIPIQIFKRTRLYVLGLNTGCLQTISIYTVTKYATMADISVNECQYKVNDLTTKYKSKTEFGMFE